MHPTGLVHPDEPDAKVKFLAAEALRGCGAMIVDKHGKRIANELGRRDYVTGRMWKTDAPHRLILNGKATKEIVCKTPGGTDLVATFSSHIPWIPTSGIISTKKWGNLPGGETFTSPIGVEGIFVVDGAMGDWLAHKYGDMRDHPLTIHIENSRVAHATCDHRHALNDFMEYISEDPNGNRVGEYALGTNTAVPGIIGNMLQDEKIPGVHIAFGHPYTEHTGADWSAKTHVDMVGRDFDIWFDGAPIMTKGRYLTNGEV